MPTNDFIGFASSGSANIMSQADFAAAAEQTSGVQPGPASSTLANKVWRQGANMAAAIGSFIAARGYNAFDDGDIAALMTSFDSALCETGTWTPVLKGGTTAGAFTGAFYGDYRKMGKLVFVRFGIAATCTTQPIGTVTLTGLPFTPSTTAGNGISHGLTLTRAAGGTLQSIRRLCNIRFTSAANIYFDAYQFTDGLNYTASFVSTISLSDTSNPNKVCIQSNESLELSGCGWYECD